MKLDMYNQYLYPTIHHTDRWIKWAPLGGLGVIAMDPSWNSSTCILFVEIGNSWGDSGHPEPF